MGRRLGKKPFSSFSSLFSSSSKKKPRPTRRTLRPASVAAIASPIPRSAAAAEGPAPDGCVSCEPKCGRKKAGTRLWMRLDRAGRSEILEYDKGTVIKRTGIPTRDFRILGPIFSCSSTILARDRAMVINLEFIKAIITTDEVFLLDPLSQEVLPFVDQLRQLFAVKGPSTVNKLGQTEIPGKEMQLVGVEFPNLERATAAGRRLPFEFQVLEIALEIICSCLDARVAELEKIAYPLLDALAKSSRTKNLDRVRSLKSDLTHLLARVQKVRDEIEHILDDHEDMAHFYITRKQNRNQQFEALPASGDSNSIVAAAANGVRVDLQGTASIVPSVYLENDVEDLEMLLEAYFMQLDAVRNRILTVREYIDDTEDYVNIQLDNQRNELIKLHLILIMGSFAITIDMFIVGAFAMNIPCHWYHVQGLFAGFVSGTSSACVLVFLLLFVYARWKKLLGS